MYACMYYSYKVMILSDSTSRPFTERYRKANCSMLAVGVDNVGVSGSLTFQIKTFNVITETQDEHVDCQVLNWSGAPACQTAWLTTVM